MDDKDLVFHLALNSSILHNWYEDFKAFNFEVSHDRILDVTYENLLNGDDLRKICLFLGLDLMLFDASVKHNEFDRKQKIEKKRFKERGPKALFRRKGVVGEGSKLITAEVYELLAR